VLVKVVAVLVAFAAASVAGGYLYLRRSLPTVDGAIEVPGVAGPVDIVRDADDIPHVFAGSKLDALFGLGYVHAQDRLWQMEFQRRIGAGRLSEIFGDATLPEDRFLRTVGFGRSARAAWAHLSDDARLQVNAYVAGVNAFIASHHGSELPPEFSLLRFEPEPWSGADVLAWVKMMAWDLSANYSFELMRHDVEARVGAARMAELLPPYPAAGPSILDTAADLPRESDGGASLARPDRHETRRAELGRSEGTTPSEVPIRPGENWSRAFELGLGEPASAVRRFLLASRVEALGSNNWVVDGTMTASGKPLLANDPHLATHIPSLWYLAHLSAGDFDVIGATLPGTPAVAIGRNRFIAWGETNVAADVEDLYRERLSPDGSSAEFRGVQEPLQVVKETIAVRGAAPVAVDVRITRHGPLVSDAINANAEAAKGDDRPSLREPLAFRWTALDEEDGTIQAFLRLNEARNWTDFTAALRDFVVPAQNFVYADVAGHIGYYAPGRIPIRAHRDGAGGEGSTADGSDLVSTAVGSRPADGWTGDAEWIGWIPFDELPHAFDPPSHFIVTANNRPAPASYPFVIALEYPNPYRAERIRALLRGRTGLTVEDFRAIQGDTFSGHAQELLPLLLAHVHPTTPGDRTAVDVLKHWNLDARPDSAAAAIFDAWFLRLAPTIVGDDLGASALQAYRGRFSYVTRFIESLLPQTGEPSAAAAAWCDDSATPERETCDDEVTRALGEGVASLAGQLSPDEAKWRWDAVHHAVFPHQGLDSVPVLHRLLSRATPAGGDWSTVNVGPVDVDHPYDQISIPGYRQIIDLSPANDSLFIDAVGQSGHFLSPRYDDALAEWRQVEYRKMRMRRADIEEGAVGHLHLTPR